jgi:hypothetical protein
MKSMLKNIVAASIAAIALNANAALLLNITEDLNNDVLFTFSGSSTVTGNNSYARNGFWFGDITDQIYSGATGGYSGLNNFSAANITQGGNSGLSDIYLNGGFGHELGIRLQNFGILTNANGGDQITWSGQATLNLNFSDFMAGSWSGNRLIANGADNLMLSLGDGYVINVGVAAPVPEPETYAMMLAGLGLLGLAQRRRKQKLAA